MIMDVYVTALIEMKHMKIDVPDGATSTDIVRAVNRKILMGEFYPDSLPELRSIEDNNSRAIWYDD